MRTKGYLAVWVCDLLNELGNSFHLLGFLAVSAGVVVNESLEAFFDLSSLGTVIVRAIVIAIPDGKVVASIFIVIVGRLEYLSEFLFFDDYYLPCNLYRYC